MWLVIFRHALELNIQIDQHAEARTLVCLHLWDDASDVDSPSLWQLLPWCNLSELFHLPGFPQHVGVQTRRAGARTVRERLATCRSLRVQRDLWRGFVGPNPSSGLSRAALQQAKAPAEPFDQHHTGAVAFQRPIPRGDSAWLLSLLPDRQDGVWPSCYYAINDRWLPQSSETANAAEGLWRPSN